MAADTRTEHLRLLLDLSPVPMLATELETGRVHAMNRYAERLFLVTQSEAQGKTTVELRFWRLSDNRAAYIEKMRSGSEEASLEAQVDRKDGTTRDCLLSSHILADGLEPTLIVSTLQDITERKMAEERYRELFENLTTGFALHEVLQDESGKVVDYRFLEVNPAYERLTGLLAADIIGKKITEALPGIEQGWIEMLGSVAVTGVPVRYENHVAKLDKWYETWTYRPAPRQFAVFVTDMTERRKQEEELRRSEEKYRLLAENTTDVISRIAKDGTIAYISPSITTAVGWPPEHFLGKPATADIHPDDIPVLREAAALARTTGQEARPIYRNLHRDGSWIWAETSLRLVHDEHGDLDGMVASSRDVTARIAAEQALKEREERLRLVLDATSDGIFDWDIPSGSVHYSATNFAMLGYEPGAFPGTFEAWRSRIHPEDWPRTDALLQAHLDDPAVLYSIEYRIATKDGEWKWIMARGKVVSRAPDGNPLRMVGTHTDITERKLAEKALAESEERFRFLAENSLDVVLRLDLQGTITWASPSLGTVLDQDPVTSIGLSSLASIHPDDQARITSEIAETLRSDTPRKAVYRHVTRTGKVLWVESIGRALHNPQTGSVEGLLVSTRDITEQKRQSELFEETQRLAHMGGWQFYFDTTTTVWTREMKRIFGLAPEDPPLSLETLKSLLEPQSLRLYEESFRQLMRDGTPWDIPLRGRTIDGRLLLARLTCDCERGPDGRFIAIRGSMQDVTESELLRERFESASRLNQSILSTTEALLVLLDLEGRIVRFNEACQRISGWSETEMLGLSVIDALVPGDEHLGVHEMFDSLVAQRVPSQMENHWVARDGQRFWISWVNSVILDEGGTPLYVLCTGIDMTAHRATQLKLLETQERWRILIETAPEAILILDAENYRFTQTNPAAVALFGLPEEEILAHGPLEISPPFQLSGMTSRDTLDLHCRNALQGPATTFEWIHTRPEGREILCQVNLSRLPSEGHPLLRASVVDITERRKTESVMQSLVQHTSSLFGQAFFDALVRDLASLLEVRYAFVARITPDGSSVKTVAFVADGSLAPSLSYPIAGSPCADVLAKGMLFQSSAIRERYPDSLILDALAAESYMGVPLRGVENRPIGILAVADSKPMAGGELAKSILSIFAGRAQGEMERHEAEIALRRLNGELEQRVQERTAELVVMNRELESFAYSVSHDLRSPLRSINGFAQALSEDYGPSLDDQALGYLERIRNASRRMSELIDDLLSLSQSSRKALHKSDVDLSSMASEIIQTLREGDPKRIVEFQVDPDLHAWANPVLIRAVMENLLGNSWKYTLRTEHPTIHFRYEPPSSGMAAFAVVDDGAGFDMTFSQKLFGTFQRLHGADEFEGNGIGLATVKRILERHGGTIRGRGEIGKGATFVFELPVFAG